jgi:hypothetical protein
MKNKKMWTLAALGAATLIGVAAYSLSSPGIETPEYRVLQSIGDVEIRYYPSMVVARTPVGSASFDQSGSNGFREIAGYIFGGNARNQKIAMTAPVVMNMSDSATMYFVMPKEYAAADLPQPNSGRVVVAEEAPKVLAVLRFGGFTNDREISAKCIVLGETLAREDLQPAGAYLYMGYNAPWDVVNRRNEVAVEVEWDVDGIQ